MSSFTVVVRPHHRSCPSRGRSSVEGLLTHLLVVCITSLMNSLTEPLSIFKLNSLTLTSKSLCKFWLQVLILIIKLSSNSSFYFKFLKFFIMCLCVCVVSAHECSLTESTGRNQLPRTGVTGDWEPPDMVLGTKLLPCAWAIQALSLRVLSSASIFFFNVLGVFWSTKACTLLFSALVFLLPH